MGGSTHAILDLLLGLARSVGLLAVVSIAYTYAVRNTAAEQRLCTLLLGLLFGVGAVVAMLMPVELEPGVFIDARCVLLGVAAPFGGPGAALIAGGIAGAFRIWQGGAGMLAGLAGMALTVAAGIAFDRVLHRRGGNLGTRELLLLGVVIGPLNLSGALLLPSWTLVSTVLTYAAAPLLLAALVGILFLGTLMLHERQRFEMERELAESERRFRMVFGGVRDVVFKTDGDGCWSLLNPAWTEITGLPVEECLGRSFLDYVHPDDVGKAEALFEALSAGWLQHTRQEVRYRTGKGGYRWTEMSARRVAGGMSGTLKDITQRKDAEAALRESRRRFQEITSVLTEGLYSVDENGLIQYVNPAAETMLGWRREELIGREAHATFHHTHPDGTPFPLSECSVHRAIGTGRRVTVHEDHFVRKDGSFLPIALAAAPIVRDGKVRGAVAAFHEISERLRQQQVLRESEESYRVLFNSSNDAIFVHHIGADGVPTRFIAVNDVACERLGYTREELLEMAPGDIDDPDSARNDAEVLARIQVAGFATFERVHVTRDGRRIPVEINARRFLHKGEPAMIALARDITERKRAEERIYRLAHYDALTDLPNRRLLMDRLDRALALARRHGRQLAVLMLDLDGFKPVNDTYGHDAGDELLEVVARRLESSVRRADTIARLGGDEFVVVLTEIASVDDAELVAGKIIAIVNEPVALDGREVHVGASIGIAAFPHDGDDAPALMKAADEAMYRAKAGGRNRYALKVPA